MTIFSCNQITMNFINIKDWGLGIDFQRPYLIAGPCSAETSEQVMQSCVGAASQGACMLRAGIWKPRTRPNSFEGVGQKGLPWIKAAGEQTQRPITVEVANKTHVKEALAAGVDVLWIGARTTVNPFAVQEIANALQGVDIPVMIKNPVNPDVDLWMGAVERFYQAGIRKMAVIHRGFSVSRSAPYRNLPMWEIPIELGRRLPQLEIICDPSHICGNRELIPSVSQKAMDLNFAGLMIETHIQPDQAWSDARQQLQPAALGALMKKLILRNSANNDKHFLAQLETLRIDIDQLDHEMISLMGKRMDIVKTIGQLKKENGVTILQMNRWVKIFDSRVAATMEEGLSDDFAQAFIQCLHNESIQQQTQIMNAEEGGIGQNNVKEVIK